MSQNLDRVVLFASGDLWLSEHYIRDIKRLGLEVVSCSNAEEVIGQLERQPAPVLLVTSDVLPHGDVFNRVQTHNGLRSGRPLVKKVRESLPNLPAIILVDDPDMVRPLEDFQDARTAVMPVTERAKLAQEVKLLLQGVL